MSGRSPDPGPTDDGGSDDETHGERTAERDTVESRSTDGSPARGGDTGDRMGGGVPTGTRPRVSLRRGLLSGGAALVGAWVVLAPFVFDAGDPFLWNNVITGAAILFVAGYNYYRIANDRSTSPGAMALVAVLGVWLVIAPFIIAPGDGLLRWSTVLAGLVVTLLAGYVAYAGRNIGSSLPIDTP